MPSALMYTKLFAKTETYGGLIETIRICSWDVGMEFCIEKSAMIMKKSGKRQKTKGMAKSRKRITTFRKRRSEVDNKRFLKVVHQS